MHVSANKLLYRVPEAVEVSGMSRSRLYEKMTAGELESVKVGRTRLIPHDALVAFIDRLREGVGETGSAA